MANDNLPTLGEVSGGGSTTSRQKRADNDPAGFFESAISAGTRELVGFDAQQDVRRYRGQNPTAGTISQIGGQLLYFAFPLTRPGIALTRTLPIFGRGVRSGERLISEGKSALGEAAKDVSSMGAFESGRIGASAALGGDVSEVAGEAAFELALVGGGSALIGHLARSLPPAGRPTDFETQITKEIDPEYNLNAPPQVKMQKMSELREKLDDQGLIDEVDRHLVKFANQTLEQDIPNNRRAVRRIAKQSENEGDDLATKLQSLFASGENKGRQSWKLVDGRGGFQKKNLSEGQISDTKELFEKAALPDGFQKNMFLPRYHKVKTREEARKFQKMLNQMSPPTNAGGRQTWITREIDDGPYIMVRRANESMERIKPGDEFVSFKTDDPVRFGPELGTFNKIQDENFLQLEKLNSRIATGSITRSVEDMESSMPDVGIISGEMASGISNNQLASKITEGILGAERMGRLRHAFGRTSDFFGKFTREFAAPSLNRYGGKNGNARAAKISMMGRAITDRAQLEKTKHLAGKLDDNYKNAIWKDVFKMQSPRKSGILRRIDDIEDADMPHISEAFRKNLSPDDMKSAGMRQGAIDFMEFLNKKDREILSDVNANLDDLDLEQFEGMNFHYMLSRMWEGRIRIPIKKRNGRTVAVASGRNTKQAKEEAERLTKVINDEGQFDNPVSFNPSQVRYADAGEDLDQIVDVLKERGAAQNIEWLRAARDPDRFKERTGVRGFKGEAEDLTHKDLRQILSKQVGEMYDLVASRTVQQRLRDERHRLYEEDPSFSRMVEAELKTRAGQRGEWTKATEDAVDRILTPVFGVRASEVVRGINNAIFQLTLGMGNLGFAVLNAVTFMQTALPEIAWLMHTPPARLRSFYGMDLVRTPQGLREINSLSPLKLMRQGLNDMSNPPDELWELYKRARDEGRVAPVLSEEVFGPNSDIIRHLKGFFQEHRTLPETIQEISAYLPARTEELSRSMALSMGYRMGKDFMGLAGEDLYQFATRFVDNTHFRYAAADRPQLLRGAFGSLLGLFKSWMLHYVGNQMRYAGDATRYGNFGPLLWGQAGTMSIAGLSGTAVLPIAEGMNGLMSDEPMVQNLYEGLGWQDSKDFSFVGSPADGIYFGLPAFLNLSLSHRAAVPGADIPNDIEQLYTIMHWDRAVALGDLFGGTIDTYYATGEHPANSQQVRDAMYRAFLPRTAQSIMQGVNERGTRSLRTQNTILSEQTWTETTINALGFQPNRLARTYEQMDILFERQQESREAIAAFGEMYAQAKEANDAQQMLNIMQRAQYNGIPVESIKASARSRLGKREEGLLERMFTDERDMAMQRALGGGQ